MRRISRASSSIDLPCCAARTRSLLIRLSSRLRMVMLAIGFPPGDGLQRNAVCGAGMQPLINEPALISPRQYLRRPTEPRATTANILRANASGTGCPGKNVAYFVIRMYTASDPILWVEARVAVEWLAAENRPPPRRPRFPVAGNSLPSGRCHQTTCVTAHTVGIRPGRGSSLFLPCLKEIRMEFKRAFSGAPWEKKVGYCRSLRAGDTTILPLPPWWK